MYTRPDCSYSIQLVINNQIEYYCGYGLFTAVTESIAQYILNGQNSNTVSLYIGDKKENISIEVGEGIQ